MADESSDEDVDIQNGYDGELDIFLPNDSESDNSDSAGNVTIVEEIAGRTSSGVLLPSSCESAAFVTYAYELKSLAYNIPAVFFC